MRTVYAGHYASTFTDFAQDAGGILEFEIRRIDGSVITQARFEIEDHELVLKWEGTYHEGLVALIRYLDELGLNRTAPTGSNEDGNAANGVIGNRAVYAHCFYLDISFAEWVGKIDRSQPKLISAKAPKAPKAPKISKADQRIMRPANGKAVWNDAYIKAKGIDYADFIAKHGKQQVYDDLGSMTVIEFETKYGLR